MGCRVLVLCAVVMAFCVGAVPASATIVYERNNAIWTMNDDGSDQQALITTAQVPGALRLFSPSIHPSGGPILFNATDNDYYGSSGPYHGSNYVGVYSYDRGVIKRLSGARGPCVGVYAPNCTTNNLDPEPFGNGRYVAELFVLVPSGNTFAGSGALFTDSMNGGDYQDFPARCGNDGSSVYPSDPSPNPANANEVAYTGCFDQGSRVMWVDRVNNSPADEGFYDDYPFMDPSWRPDGGRLVWGEGGSDNGLWSAPSDGSQPTHLADLPNIGIPNSPSPRFVGSDQIVFSYDAAHTDGSTPDLYKLPATGCGATACALSAATRLTTDGVSTNPAWTSVSRAALLPAPPAGGSGGNPGGSGDPGAGNNTGNNTGTGTGTGNGGSDTTAPIAAAGVIGKPKLGAALSKGFNVKVSSNEPGSAEVDGFVSGKDAKGLKIARRKLAAHGKKTIAGAGSVKVRVKFTKKAHKKFRKAKKVKMLLVVIVTDSAGNYTAKQGSITLKR